MSCGGKCLGGIFGEVRIPSAHIRCTQTLYVEPVAESFQGGIVEIICV